MTTLQERPVAPPVEPEVKAPVQRKLHTLKIKGLLKKNLSWYTDGSIEARGMQTAAEEAFNEAIAQGYAGFNTTTTEGEQIRSFDPEAEEIMMFAPIAGGR